MTGFWLAGGTAGLDTVGGEVERQARERGPEALAVLTVTLVAKLAAAALALALGDRRKQPRRKQPRRPRWLATLARAGGILLALYGAVLVVAGALALAGALGSVDDEYALRWHTFFWDPWFLIWGIALAVAGGRAR